MRIKLHFECDRPFCILPQHNEMIQGLLYNNMEEHMSKFLHDVGYPYEKRVFKLFTFSRIQGLRYDEYKNMFLIPEEFDIVVSSPKQEIVDAIINGFRKAESLNINGYSIKFKQAVIEKDVVFKNTSYGVYMLSPVTVYSTLIGLYDKKKTYYYNPYEREFTELIKANLVKKYKLIHGKDAGEFEFRIEPLSRCSEKILLYKDFVVKGWMGNFEIKTDPDIMSVAYEAGIGAKNSQGFGMFELI